VRSGAKHRALDALERSEHIASVHDVAAVQSLASGLERVGVKLEWYRENPQLSGPLLRAVERSFMAMDPGSGEWIVSAARVRDAGTGQLRRGSPGPQAAQGRNAPLGPLMAGAEKAASRHSARAVQALAHEREQQLGRRVEHLRALQRRQMRQEQAERTRPWVTWQVAATAALVMRGFLVAYRHAFEASDAVDAECGAAERWRRMGKQLWHEAALRMGSADLRAFRLLRQPQLDPIGRLVMKSRLDHAESRRKNHLWRMWACTLRLSIAVVRLQRPYRVHVSMEIAKDFIEKSWRGFRIRRSVKSFLRKVRVLQRAIRCSCRIARVIRTRVLVPQVWALETMLLGRTAGIQEELLEAEVARHLEACGLERWRQEAQRLQRLRVLLIHGAELALGPAPGPGAAPRARWPSLEAWRLSPEEREQLAALAFRENLDAWWELYRSFKQARPASSRAWVAWRLALVELDFCSHDLWPEHPPVMEYPEELTKLRNGVLKRAINARLQQSRSLGVRMSCARAC